MSRFVLDVRHAFRSWRQAPGFTIVSLLTLALSLGANTAIFTFVNAVLLQPLPFAHADRIVRVLEKRPDGGLNGISTLNFLDWQKQNTCFDYLAAQTNGGATITGAENSFTVRGAWVSARYFDIFSVPAALGRTFVDGEDQAGKDHVAVLSYTLWQDHFGGDAGIIGRTIAVDREPFTVVGILPAGSALERNGTRLWRPLTFKPENMSRDYHWFGATGRIKEGVTIEKARAEMDAVAARIAHDFPASNKGWGVGIDRLADTRVGGEVRVSLYVLFGAVGMVLLIACANLANLSLMRLVRREREIAVRVAIGATRWILIRQFMTETLVLALAGAALGLLVGHYGVMAIKAALPSNVLPSDARITLDPMVLLFSFGLAVLTTVIVGLLPALTAMRPDLTKSLKQGGAGSAGTRSRLRSTLVVAEMALAFVLLTGAGLLIRSLDNLSRVNPGFDSTNVLTFRLPISDKQYRDPAALNAHLASLRSALAALPGVEDVALTSALPMQGWGYGMPFQVADQPIADRANRKGGFFKMVSPSYFRALRMHLLQGRLLTDRDTGGAPPAAVINETMAKQFFAGVNAIGKRVLVQEILLGKTQLGGEVPWEVVGVVADEKVGGLDDGGNSPGLYVTTEQSPTYGISAVLRSATDSALLREAVKKAVQAVSPSQAVANVKTLEAIKEESLTGNRVRATLLGIFAGVSLLLAAIGIYGVISYSISQRTREIGVRTALGATRGNIARLVMTDGIRLVGIGLVIGVGGTFALTQVLASMLFGVGRQDPVTLTLVALMLVAVALLACVLPALRATKVDPLVALRCE